MKFLPSVAFLAALCVCGAYASIADFVGALSKVLSPDQIVTDASTMGPVYNPRFPLADFTPSVIVFPSTDGEVQFVVKSAVAAGVPLAVRSGAGHSYIGQSTNAGGAVMSVFRLKGFSVVNDGGSYTVRVGAGTNMLELYTKLGTVPNTGLAFPGGSCPTVGVSGLLSGGGMGTTSAAYGIASDRVVAADVVVFEASQGDYAVVHATPSNQYANLLFAMRSGMGGNYGVATTWYLSAEVAPASAYLFVLKAQKTNVEAAMPYIMAYFKYFDDHPTLGMWTEVFARAGGYFEFKGHCNCVDADCSQCETAVNTMLTAVFGAPGCSGFFYKCSLVQQPFEQAMWSWASCTSWGGGAAYPIGGIRGATPAEIDDAYAACYSYDGVHDTMAYTSKSLFYGAAASASGFQAAFLAAVKLLDDPRADGNGILQFEIVNGAMVKEPQAYPACTACSATGRSTAWTHRTPGWHSQLEAYWDPSEGANPAGQLAWLSDVYNTMVPVSLGTAYQNYIDASLSVAEWSQQYFGADVFNELVAIKATYNPHNAFHVAHTADMEIPSKPTNATMHK